VLEGVVDIGLVKVVDSKQVVINFDEFEQED
jgi:hypothetical protein